MANKTLGTRQKLTFRIEPSTKAGTARPRNVFVPLARGRYALPTAVDPRRSAVRLGGLTSHTSAALFWGLEVARAPLLPQVTVARSRSRVRARGAS